MNVRYLFYTFLLLCLGVAAPVQALERVSLKLQWLDQFQFAGYYVAKEKGFYRKAGLQVKIVPYTQGGQDVVREVLDQKVTFGTGRSSLLAERVHGKGVVALAGIFQDTPSVLITLKKTKIEQVSDLVGRRIMITPDEMGAAATMGMLAAEGVRPFDIIRQNHSYNLDDLINGKTDAMACYVSNEPFILQEKGIETNSFAPSDYGQNFYGDLLFTSEQERTQNPKRVKAFVEASLKGWAYAFDNIEETAKLIKAKYNGQDKSLPSLIFEGEALKKLAYKDNLPLGHLSEQKWKAIAAHYHKMGVFADYYQYDGFIWKAR